MTFKNESSIEIAASPAKVREVLLNFSAYSEWHTDFIRSVKIQGEDKTPQLLVPGDKLECNIQGFKFIAEIKTNTEERFSWQGPPVLTIAGLYSFRMEPIKNGTATIFTQSEEVSGLLAWLMSPLLLGRKVVINFEGFNRDLKTRCEAA